MGWLAPETSAAGRHCCCLLAGNRLRTACWVASGDEQSTGSLQTPARMEEVRPVLRPDAPILQRDLAGRSNRASR